MKLKSATRFTLFSTLLMTVVNLVFFMYFLSFIATRTEVDYSETAWFFVGAMAVLLAGTALISYLISSLVVDRILNPVRGMSAKVREIGDRHFTGRLVIDSDEDELVEYADAFNEMVIKINDYIEKQKRFVSDASHELSTPLTVINGHADMLLRWAKDDPVLLADGLTVIKNEALRMNTLVEDLLFFARSDNRRQPYNFKLTDMRSLLAECADEARGMLDGYEVSYTYAVDKAENGEPRKYSCDTEKLRRVLRILIDNAVKHGGECKRIDLIAEETDGGLRVCVRDYGPGIPPEYVSRVFDRFFRVDDSRVKKTGGSGLGLAIAREIAESHHGALRAENAEPGARFVFTLP